MLANLVNEVASVFGQGPTTTRRARKGRTRRTYAPPAYAATARRGRPTGGKRKRPTSRRTRRY